MQRRPRSIKRIEFGKGVAEFRARVGTLARPTTRPLGLRVRRPVRAAPVRATLQAPALPEEREPLVDALEERDCIRVTAELPGVDEKDIKLGVEGDLLTISAESPRRRYRREVKLPGTASWKSS